ncbi:hypothetical protein E2C01_072512 [Portunus trituberculatus]|uniref:Uncharacterized protein n=1 Tax=Portunus trituberculatus TaxID=210409 RepID=A0A5B7I819_PORTR|nr:hypothetical protein [Portunus trituberculatus]
MNLFGFFFSFIPKIKKHFLLFIISLTRSSFSLITSIRVSFVFS